jgi:hypothetical protein
MFVNVDIFFILPKSLCDIRIFGPTRKTQKETPIAVRGIAAAGCTPLLYQPVFTRRMSGAW